MHARDRLAVVALLALVPALVLGLVLAAPGAARADEPFLLSLEGSAAVPVTAPQADWFEPGGSLAISVWRSLASPIALGARLRGGLLADGPAPRDPTLADPGIGSFFTLAVGARLRLEAIWDDSPRRGTGPWVEALGGAALTGASFRPSLEVGIGWGFELGDVDLGPTVRWSTVFETDSQLAPEHANMLLVGVELTLFDARPAATEEVDPAAIAEARDNDRCPDEDEDVDGFQDDDGCPDLDNDADGVPDAVDACPNAPEDRDGLMDEDGCPERDADADGILDELDACPLERETVNGIDDADGCPDRGLIELVDDRIVLEERVLFALNRARVRHRALPVIEAIVELTRQHPEWAELRIEGHADVQGDRAFNQRLSERRAHAVRTRLVEGGIPGAIISSVGYGETHPRVRGNDEEAYRANRRVEFVVVRRVADPATRGGVR
jgi:outer membrane protein OmpA-like peptidoglycan-associated protein